MTNKFTIGSQWLTRGGWRAVVVDDNNGFPVVWHYHDYDTWTHNLDGSVCDMTDDYYLDKPYTEPRKGTVWVNVWYSIHDDYFFSLCFDNEKAWLEDKAEPEYRLIASFKNEWKEGDKI